MEGFTDILFASSKEERSGLLALLLSKTTNADVMNRVQLIEQKIENAVDKLVIDARSQKFRAVLGAAEQVNSRKPVDK